MENLTKKINMIDIFGMILPGGLMLLLFEKDLHCLRELTKILGIEDAGNLLWSFIFLCGSYILGMLLHELGSVVEKLMWNCLLLNPKAYAAMHEGLIQMDIGSSHKKGGHLKHGIAVLFALLKGIVSIAPALFVIALAAGFPEIAVFERSGCLAYFLLVVVAIFLVSAIWNYIGKMVKYCKLLCDETKRKELWDIVIDGRCSSNFSDNEECERKRILCRGFYSLARSSLVLLAIVQLYVIMQSGHASALVALCWKIRASLAFHSLRWLIVIALVLRYWHYSRLYFIYSYRA